MKTSRLTQALVLLLATGSVMTGCNRDKGAAPDTATGPDTSATAPTRDPSTASIPEPAIEPVPATAALVSVSSVTIGNAAAPDRTVPALSTLGTQDDIVVSVRTDGSAQNVTLGARLTYEDGQVAGEQTASLNTNAAETTNITFANAKAWPAGRYTVQVMVDGQPVASQNIEIR